jgi:pimeloyl-ACP methyl ester carboxylesterase
LLSRDTAAQPETVFLLFSGGYGDHSLGQRGEVVQVFNDHKYLARVRKLFVGAGTAAALVDTPSDRSRLDDASRMSEQHAQDVEAVIQDLKQRFGAPRIVLIGHSNGSISAAHVGRALGAAVDSVVLVNGRLVKHWFGGDGLATFDFSQLRSRLLLVHHAKDDCTVTRYEGAKALAERYPLITVDDPNVSASGGCNGGTHNMTGKDKETVEAILDWVKGAPWPKEI